MVKTTARAAITRYHRPDSTETFSHNSGGYKSKVKVSAGLVPSEASPLGLHMAIFSLCPHVGFRVCLLNLFFLERNPSSYWVRTHFNNLILH